MENPTKTQETQTQEALDLGIPEPMIEILDEIEGFYNEIAAFHVINEMLNS